MRQNVGCGDLQPALFAFRSRDSLADPLARETPRRMRNQMKISVSCAAVWKTSDIQTATADESDLTNSIS
jgi:hypothetical protein